MDFLPESGEDCRGSGETMTQTGTPEPHTGIQGEGGVGRDQGREDAGGVGAACSTFTRTRSRNWKAQLLEGAAGRVRVCRGEHRRPRRRWI